MLSKNVYSITAKTLLSFYNNVVDKIVHLQGLLTSICKPIIGKMHLYIYSLVHSITSDLQAINH